MTNHRGMSRRRLLKVGGLGALGLTLPELLRAEAEGEGAGAGKGPAPIRSCILVFYYGGPSHIDTVDMKPKAPAEVRGTFGSIATSAPGLRVCEHLPHTARVMDRLAILRAMHHPMTNHNAAAFATLCGRNPLKGDLEILGNDRNDPPCYGAALSALLPARRGLPTAVALPHVMYNVVQLPGQEAGFLGSAHVPFQVNADPGAPDFRLGDLDLPTDLTIDRLDHRAELLRRLDARRRRIEEAARTRADAWPDPSDVYTEKAFSLLHSPAVRKAFDLAAEDPRLRDRYGRTKLGQSMLLARRLVEAGVRFITVYDGQYNGQLANWDSHQDVFPRHKNDLLAAGRPGLRGPDRRPDRARAAGRDVGHRHGRVRPDAQDQRHRRARPLAVLLQHHPGRRRGQGRDRAWLERQAGRLPRHRCRHPRRPRRDLVLAAGPRPDARDRRPHRPALQAGRRPADPGGLRVISRSDPDTDPAG